MIRLALPALGLALGLTGVASALQDGDAATAAPAAPASSAGLADAFGPENRTDEAIATASKRIDSVAKAYRAAPTLTDTLTIEVATPMGPQTENLELIFGRGSDLKLDVQGMEITSLDDELFIVIPEVSTEKYVGVPLKDDSVAKTLETVADGFSLPLPHFALRYGDNQKTYMDGFTVGSLQDLKVAGFKKQPETSEILFEGSNGAGVATVNGATGLLDSYVIEFQPVGAPEGMTFKLSFGFDPTVSGTLATPITFDPGTRARVNSLDALMQKLQVGDPAPTFSLKTSDGKTVNLADLRGSVVVLDLWATWCGPCRKGLPLLNEFATWARDSSKSVVVFGLNVWEDQQKDAAKRTEQATAFWKEQGYGFPTLLDLDDAVAEQYGPNGIPTTFIIDPEGRIAAVHTGFDPKMVETLKKDVASILQVSG